MKRKLIIIFIVVVAMGGFSLWFLSAPKNEILEPSVFHDKSLQMFETSKNGTANIFINKTYGYSIEFPQNWDFYINDKSRVTFGDPAIDMPSPNFNVIVVKSELKSLSELDYKTDLVRFESDTLIDNQRAVITHQGSDFEEYINEKIVYVLKNGFLYKIGTNHLDHEAVWKSFKFLDK